MSFAALAFQGQKAAAHQRVQQLCVAHGFDPDAPVNYNGAMKVPT